MTSTSNHHTIEMSLDAWVAEIVRRPISVAVSKPQAGEETQRVHVPASRDEAKYRLKEPAENTATRQQVLRALFGEVPDTTYAPERPIYGIQHDTIRSGHDEEEKALTRSYRSARPPP